MTRRLVLTLSVMCGCPSSPAQGDEGGETGAETEASGSDAASTGDTTGSSGTGGEDASSGGSAGEPSGGDEPFPVPPPEGGEVCVPGGWCWIAPGPTGAHLYDVASAGEGHTWAVGEGGLVMRLHEGSWTGAYEADVDLHAVAAASPSEVWAVGNDGVVLRFDGQTWADAPSPTGAADLRDVWIDPSTNAPWVVGDDVIASWNGEAWDVLEKPVDTELLVHWTAITGAAEIGDANEAPPGRIGVVGVLEDPGPVSTPFIYTVWIDGETVTAELAQFPSSSEWPLDIGRDADGVWWLVVDDLGSRSELHRWSGGWSLETTSDSFDEPSRQAGFRKLGRTPEGDLLVLGSEAWAITGGIPSLEPLPLQPYLRASATSDPGFHGIALNDAGEGWLVGGVGELVELRDGLPESLNTDGVKIDGMSQLPGTDRMLGFGTQDGVTTVYEIDETPAEVLTLEGYTAIGVEAGIGADGSWALPMAREVGGGGAVLLRSPAGEFSQTADSTFVPETALPLPDDSAIVVYGSSNLGVWDQAGLTPACPTSVSANWVARIGEEVVFEREAKVATEVWTWTPEGCTQSAMQPPEASLTLVRQMPTQAWFSTLSGDLVRLTADGWTPFDNPLEGFAHVSASPEGWPWLASADAIATYDGSGWTLGASIPFSGVDLHAFGSAFAEGAATSASGRRYLYDRNRIIAER